MTTTEWRHALDFLTYFDVKSLSTSSSFNLNMTLGLLKVIFSCESTFRSRVATPVIV